MRTSWRRLLAITVGLSVLGLAALGLHGKVTPRPVHTRIQFLPLRQWAWGEETDSDGVTSVEITKVWGPVAITQVSPR